MAEAAQAQKGAGLAAFALFFVLFLTGLGPFTFEFPLGDMEGSWIGASVATPPRGDISIRWRPPGANCTRSPGATRTVGKGRMRLMPLSTRVSCMDTSPKRSLRAPTSTTGVRQAFNSVK